MVNVGKNADIADAIWVPLKGDQLLRSYYRHFGPWLLLFLGGGFLLSWVGEICRSRPMCVERLEMLRYQLLEDFSVMAVGDTSCI